MTCDPYLNHKVCNYDGGDCCRSEIADIYCHDPPSTGCVCHLDDTRHPSVLEVNNLTCPIQPFWKNVTNTKCEDDFNIEECGWDGGACCYEFIDDSRCTYCLCHEDGKRHPSHFTKKVDKVHYKTEKGIDFFNIYMCQKLMGTKYPKKIGDMLCDDVANNRFCNYDGGDCCIRWIKGDMDVSSVETNYKMCEEDNCICHLTGKEPKQLKIKDLVSDLDCVKATKENELESERYEGKMEGLGDGECHDYLDIIECEFDLGDCMISRFEDPGL